MGAAGSSWPGERYPPLDREPMDRALCPAAYLDCRARSLACSRRRVRNPSNAHRTASPNLDGPVLHSIVECATRGSPRSYHTHTAQIAARESACARDVFAKRTKMVMMSIVPEIERHMVASCLLTNLPGPVDQSSVLLRPSGSLHPISHTDVYSWSAAALGFRLLPQESGMKGPQLFLMVQQRRPAHLFSMLISIGIFKSIGCCRLRNHALYWNHFPHRSQH